MDYELRDGYVRFRIVNRDMINLIAVREIVKGKNCDKHLTDEQHQTMSNIYDMYEIEQTKRNENITKFG